MVSLFSGHDVHIDDRKKQTSFSLVSAFDGLRRIDSVIL